MRILTVLGTRPEAVKMAPVIQALARTSGVDARLCVTAQHREMLDQVLNLFAITPHYDLDLMQADQSLASLSARIFLDLDPLLADFKPDWVLVQGDTTTVAITALLSYYRRIRVGHVEAGLRTHDKWQPFPEELNRRVAGVIADLHFAPTQWACDNLLAEGVSAAAIAVTGNPVIDALQAVSSLPAPQETIRLFQSLGIKTADSQPQGTSRRLVLVTAHRRENFGPPLENICAAIQELAGRGDVEIVYPVHLNPNVQEPVFRLLGNTPHVTLLPPIDYLPMIHLMKNADLILTDSGGIQEEAPAFGIPVLVLRLVTERPEGVKAGVLKLVGTETRRIVAEATTLLDDRAAYASMAKAVNPYGDGQAARRIVNCLLSYTG